MKTTLLTLLLLFSTTLFSQTYQFKTVKIDSNIMELNTTVHLDKEAKKIHVSSLKNVSYNNKTYKFEYTYFIKRYSIADKYQLMGCKDSVSNKNVSVEIYTGLKETYMFIEFESGKLLFK